MFTKKNNQTFIGPAAILAILLSGIVTALSCPPPPPTKPESKAGECCTDGQQGPTDCPAEPGNRVIAHTGALHESETDLVVGSVGPQYRLTRAYSNRFDQNPGVNYKGDFGWNWTSRDLMRLAVEDAGTPNPDSIRICYETTLERVLYKSTDSPLKYSRASASTADNDIYDVIEQEAISGTTYWRLTKPCGRKFFFYPFSAGRKGGRLWQEQDAVGNTLTYTYGANDRPSSVADSVNNTVEFTYYPAGDARDGLVKTVQWKFSGTVRQSVYYAYDNQQNLCRVTVTATDVQRTWLYVYAKGTGDIALEHNLLYVVSPGQYKAMQDDDVETMRPGTYLLKNENVLDGSEVWDPDPTTFPDGKSWSDYAYRRYQYGASGVSKDRVTAEVAGNGESLSFSYDTDPTDNDELPEDLRDADEIKMIITITYADGFTDEQAVDHLSRLRYRIQSDGTVTENTRYDLDSSGRLTAITYPDGRKRRTIYKTGYNPDTDAESGDATDYPSYEVIEYTDGGVQRRVLVRYTYGVADFPALPLTKVTYKVGDNDDVANGVEGTDKFTTDFAYNSDGTVKYEVQPKVNGLLPDEQNAKDYRLGTEYTYNAAGQVVYEKRFICDSYTPGSPPTFTNKVQQTQTKNEYYSTGASNGLLQYVTVDEGEGKLNLKTEYQYDDWRNPERTIVDPNGLDLTTEYDYDPTGRLLATESPWGYYTTNTYDLSRNLMQVDRYKDNTKAVQLGKTQYTHDLYGRVTVTKRYYGSGGSDYAESYTTYDNRGRVENQIDPPDADSHRHGRKFTYDKWGHVTQVAAGGVWSGGQDGSWSTNPDVVSNTTFATNYYGEGLTDTSSDGYEDNVADSDYDARARLSKATRKKSDANYGDGGTLRTALQVEYTYGDRGMVTKVENKDTDGTLFNQTTSTYDGMGRLKEQAVGDGTNSLTTKYEYDKLGRTWRVTDPSNNHTVTEYDAAGRQTKVTDGDGNIATYAYNAAGQLAKTIRKDHKPGAGAADNDYLWYVVSYAYDTEGRITKVTDEGEDTDHNGDGDGKDGADANPESSEDFLVTETHYYDDAYETSVVTTDPLSHHTKTIADGLGRQLWLKEGGSGTLGSETYARETQFNYEKTGRQTSIVSGGPDGKVNAPYAADNQTTSYTYNSHGLVASVEYPDASPNTVSYTWYTHNDALATVTDQKGLVTTYTYKAVQPDSDYYTEVRQYVSGTPDGDRDIITTADGLGRTISVVTKATVDGTQTSKVTRTYKYFGGIDTETQRLGTDGGGDARTVEYGYDGYGKVTKLYWPHTGTPTDYVEHDDFDGLGRVKTIKNNISSGPTTIATYTFLGERPATKEYPQSVASKTVRQTFWSSSTDNYDHYGRLAKSHAVRDPAGTPADVMKVNYAYDDGSNPTWRYDELSNAAPRKWSQKYEYDVMDRLTKAEQGVVGGTWPSSPSMTADKTWVWSSGGSPHLDKVGNWDYFDNDGTADDRTHNAVNEITSINSVSTHVGYDDNGNMNKAPVPSDMANHHYVCTYDFRNRLVKVETDDQTAKKVAEYFYDGLNRRIRKIAYDANEDEVSDTRYLYDGWRCIEERDENDSQELRARYVYGQLYIDEPVRMYRDMNSDGDFADEGDVNVYYIQDRLFNVVAITDTDGALVERTWYECYGKPTNRRESDGDETTASHFRNPMLSCGYRHDDETELYHVRNRYQHPMLGRWMQRDPIGYADGMNLYEYVRSNPITETDPTGQWGKDDHKELTRTSYFRWAEAQWGTGGKGPYGPLMKYVIKMLVKANLWQDSNGQAFNELERHYNRGMKEDVASAKKKFQGYMAKEIRWFNHELSKVVGIRDTKAEMVACNNALWCLGRVTHTWQDYYAHAVLLSGEAGPAWGTDAQGRSRGITGSPDEDNPKLKPSSWEGMSKRYVGLGAWIPWYGLGEHGWGEPGDRDPNGGGLLRRQDAESFVFEKYKVHLTKWFEKCWCHPGK